MNLLVLGCRYRKSPWESRETQTGKIQIHDLSPSITSQMYSNLCLCSLTISLVVEGHELHPVQPEDEGVWVGGVDARGGGVGPQELAGGVLDQLLGIAPAQPLGCILVQRGDVVALGRPDDGTEGGWGVVRRARVFPGLPHRIKGTWKINGALTVQLQVRDAKNLMFSRGECVCALVMVEKRDPGK